MENISKYITEVIITLATGSAREHAYRPAFLRLIESLNPELKVINDPARSEHGAPDFVFLKGDLTVGYTETKDIGVDLDKVEKSEQMQRYFGYSNLILTDYLEFRFFRNGERYTEPIKIGTLSGGMIVPSEKNYELLERTIKDFLQSPPEKIKSGVRLAKIMGGKARRIRENVAHYIAERNEKSEDLLKVYEVMKTLLVHDLTSDQFADMYAQTLVYGLFIARYHDTTQENFSRQEARDLVPASNPLLQHFFDHIAGASFDKRLAYIVSELCEIFSVADVRMIMDQYQKTLWGGMKWGEDKWGAPDPVIHFYEDFLKEYDSAQRVKYGAFYTPLPVVRFIVRSIDYILKTDFALSEGLADTKKKEVTRMVQGKKRKEEIHAVQILDPAVGTGTFLNEVIRHIHKSFEKQGGRWTSYVDDDLLPRLYGFELMMSPYTIAHLKLGMTLRDMGYEKFSKRLGVYLTNSLEEGHKIEGTLFESFGFMQSISEESEQASRIKNEKPIMVVLGNPPYSISSSNKSEWILDLIKDYKKDLNERKINLDDDYIKFIRFAEHFIEKNGTGIVAMITNNSFIDGVTHRQMRKHLLETFDDIYVLDLHGSTTKKEKTPNGGKDENVFDIQQGVSISIFIRTSKNKTKLGKVHHAEFFGLRKEKYEMLNANSIETMEWKKLDYKEPYYFFVPKDFSENMEYDKGFKISDLFVTYSAGIKTKVDNIAIDFSKEILSLRVSDIIQNKYSLLQMISKFDLNPKTTWEYKKVLGIADFKEEEVAPYDYRPFDSRFIYYDKNFLSRSRSEVMDNFSGKINIGLETSRNGDYIFISKIISDEHFVSDNSFKFPLYLYTKDGSKFPNLEKEILGKIEKAVGKANPEDILDYIYAVLYSPSYRGKYKEFLKIDFPRVPYPRDKRWFEALGALGKELRELHLLESPKVNQFITTYLVGGSNIVEKLTYKDNKVFINAEQYFGNVPESAWNFYIGGYQPAQKWLKDRKGRTLSNTDLEHYQKIIVVLVETDKIVKEIDKIYK